MKKTIIAPDCFEIEINGVKWLIRTINYHALKAYDALGYHVSDWSWKHAKYEGHRADTKEQYFLSRSYIKDIKEIMGVA